MTVDTKIYQDSTLALGASDLIYVSRPDGSADGKADLTALSAIVHGVNGALYVAAGSLATVATTGAYSDLTGLPTLFSGAYADLTGTPTLSTVATTGAYADLTGKPALATVATTGAYSDLTGKPSLATVATTGAYSDLTGKPTLGTAASQNTGTSGANVPLLNGGNTWGALQTLSAGGDLTPAATPSTTAIGYLGAPQNILAGSYTTVMSDAGKHFYHTSATPHTLTIDSNANVAYPIGTVMAGVNENGAGVLTIAITSDTLRWGSSTGSRSVAANGSFSLLKVTSTVWRLTGDGIT